MQRSRVQRKRMFMPVKATDVPFILMVGENDYNPGPVRHDSDDPDNMYRHYVVAGGPHSDIIFSGIRQMSCRCRQGGIPENM